MERQLIEDYRAMIIEMLPKLTEENRPFANALARLPNDIRGFGPVKEASVKKAEESKADLMAQFLKPASASDQMTSKSAEPAE